MTRNDDSTGAAPERKTRRQYLPFHEVDAGMVLADPIRLTDRHVVRFSLPAGHALTETDLRQLTTFGTEYVCIAAPDTRSAEQVADETAASAARLQRIFGNADLSRPALAALYRRVLAYRSR